MSKHRVVERAEGRGGNVYVAEKGVAGPTPHELNNIVRNAGVSKGGCAPDPKGMRVQVRLVREGGAEDRDDVAAGKECAMHKSEQGAIRA